MCDESIKVAVRVRPFNQREKEIGAKLTIEMQRNVTIISNPDNDADKKSFTFDYSYWSHDDFIEDEHGVFLPQSPGSRYASQRTIFEDLGKNVINNAFEGFNCSLFAYGQTGSGKSYSMIGYGPNKGIIPIICNELFQKMTKENESSLRYEVSVSMLEIYNENVHDLLTKEIHPKGGLLVRQSPYQGFYVQGLKKIPVASYKDIEFRIDQGTSNRTVALTNMNATSSRAHTVLIITFDQIIYLNNVDTRKSSVINLIDLAGSERADNAGASKDRLKEGANINKSLSALGNVISALAEISNSKKKIVIPYRDSVLTKLLQNALGGNSKTIMIAALSPADINYDETLSTLRYADRAKQIKTNAIINEKPMDKILRELKEENEKLKQCLSSNNLPQEINSQELTKEEISSLRLTLIEEIKAQLIANTEIIEAKDPHIWKNKLEEASKEIDIISKEENVEAFKRKSLPHLLNLNEDPQLSGIIFHFLETNETLITRLVSNDDLSEEIETSLINKKEKKKKKKNKCEDIVNMPLTGLNISNHHAIIEKKANNIFSIRPGVCGAQTRVNGNFLFSEIFLNNMDRILFGSHHLYLFINPLDNVINENIPKIIDWEFAQSELAHIERFDTKIMQRLTKDQQIIHQQLLEIIPMVSEVNAISEEFKKDKKFDTVIVPPNSQDSIFGGVKKTFLLIKVTDINSGNTWYWERGKFMNRRYLIQELYQHFLEEGSIKSIEKIKDPFWEPPEELLLGTATLFIQSLAYNLDFDDTISILNYDGDEEGSISVSVSPSTVNGRVLDENNFVDDPQSLLSRPYHFLLTISSLMLNNSKYTHGLRVRYRVFQDEKVTETEAFKTSNIANLNHNKVFSFPSITQEHLNYFNRGYITFRIFVNQESDMDNNATLHPQLTLLTPNISTQPLSVTPSLEECIKLKSDLSFIKKKVKKMEQLDLYLKNLCYEWKDDEDNIDFKDFYKTVKGALLEDVKLTTSIPTTNKIRTFSKGRHNTGKRLTKSGSINDLRLNNIQENNQRKGPMSSVRSQDNNTSQACRIL